MDKDTWEAIKRTERAIYIADAIGRPWAGDVWPLKLKRLRARAGDSQ